jgi:hypothetical protein
VNRVFVGCASVGVGIYNVMPFALAATAFFPDEKEWFMGRIGGISNRQH